MFTGIVQSVGKVSRVIKNDASRCFAISTGFTDLELGESVATNGACLTVAETTADGLAQFFVSRETLARTNLGALVAGSSVNLERALALGDRLSGHWVQGHVDGLGRLESLSRDGESALLEVSLPGALARYCVEKGSVTLDGVSLTVNAIARRRDAARLSITLVPHTLTHTRFQDLQPGEALNVEVDILAKYTEVLCRT